MSDRAKTCGLLIPLRRAIALCLLLLLGACGEEPPAPSPDEWMRPVARLGPLPGADGAPFEVLGRDRRGVLFSYPVVDLEIEELDWDRERGAARVRAALPPALRESERVQVKPHVLRDKREQTLPPRIVEVARRGALVGRSITVDLESKALQGPAETQLRLRARAIPNGGVLHTTEEVVIPARATLEFAFGFVPQHSSMIARGEPTRFSVSLCRGDSCEIVFDETAHSGLGANGWRDRVLVLSDRVGQRAAFRFEANAAVPNSPMKARDFPIWSVPTLYAAEVRTPSETNLLLISLDTLRADHLGSYGYERDTSPFIDREISARGTVFEQAFSTATATAESHMSMFTGLSPTVHGVYGSSFFRALADGIPTLAETLNQQGFETGAVTENGAIGAYRGFARGFASYYENKLRQGRSASRQIEETLTESLAWLDRHPNKRFFLFVHTYQVHSPYTPLAEFQHLFERDGIDPAGARSLPPKWHPVSYDRQIRYADAQLADFFAELSLRGLLENTIVVLLSDHGEEFIEHGALGHGPAMYDEILHVPLIVRGPTIARGRRVKEPVSLVDLMATLLDWSGVTGGGWPGASFADRAREGAANLRLEQHPIFSESRAATEFYFASDGSVRSRRMPVPSYAVRVGERKLIRRPGHPTEKEGSATRVAEPSYQYFDLASDPGERHDRSGTAGAKVQRMRELLEQHIADGEAARDRYTDAIRTEAGTPGVLDADRREKLRALGYLE